jgi:flagellar basal-body rod protein FlgB
MIDALFNNPNYVAANKLLDATVLRHEAIASNLANIETPGYKRIDLAPSFSTELKQALGSRDSSQIASLEPKLQVDPNAVAQSRDGNTVNLESEMANLQQNTLSHALETQVINYQLARLRMAITGRSA